MNDLFSYGTLQLPDVQRETFGTTVQGEADALVGFRQDMLEITDPDVLALSGERFHPVVRHTGQPEDRVDGMVFALSAEQLARADTYEVDDYERVRVNLASGREAWLYVAKGQSV